MNYKTFEHRLQATTPGSEAEQKVYDDLYNETFDKFNGEEGRQGRAARKAGLPQSANPYQGKGLHPDISRELKWNAGWHSFA